MGLTTIFQTKEQRAQELKARKRLTKRTFDNAVTDANTEANKILLAAGKWREEAKALLKAGHRHRAEMKMSEMRSLEALYIQQAKKCWLYQLYQMQISLNASDQALADAMDKICTLMEIKPTKIAAVLGNFEKNLDNRTELDEIYDEIYRGQIATGSERVVDGVPSLAEMMKELESEVAIEVGGGKVVGGDLTTNAASLREKLDKLREQGDRT